MRYTCQICGQDKYLYYEVNNMWFVEEKTKDGVESRFNFLMI